MTAIPKSFDSELFRDWRTGSTVAGIFLCLIAFPVLGFIRNDYFFNSILIIPPIGIGIAIAATLHYRWKGVLACCLGVIAKWLLFGGYINSLFFYLVILFSIIPWALALANRFKLVETEQSVLHPLFFPLFVLILVGCISLFILTFSASEPNILTTNQFGLFVDFFLRYLPVIIAAFLVWTKLLGWIQARELRKEKLISLLGTVGLIAAIWLSAKFLHAGVRATQNILMFESAYTMERLLDHEEERLFSLMRSIFSPVFDIESEVDLSRAAGLLEGEFSSEPLNYIGIYEVDFENNVQSDEALISKLFYEKYDPELELSEQRLLSDWLTTFFDEAVMDYVFPTTESGFISLGNEHSSIQLGKDNRIFELILFLQPPETLANDNNQNMRYRLIAAVVDSGSLLKNILSDVWPSGEIIWEKRTDYSESSIRYQSDGIAALFQDRDLVGISVQFVTERRGATNVFNLYLPTSITAWLFSLFLTYIYIFAILICIFHYFYTRLVHELDYASMLRFSGNEILSRFRGIGVVAISSEGQILFLNSASERILGYDESDALGQSFCGLTDFRLLDSDISGECATDILIRSICDSLASERASEITAEIRAANGQKMELSIQPEFVPDEIRLNEIGLISIERISMPARYLLMIQDHSIETARQRSHLTRSKQRITSQLIAGLSHEFNNSLAVVSNSLNEIGLVSDSKKVSDYVEDALLATNSSLRVVETLLGIGDQVDMEGELFDAAAALVASKDLFVNTIANSEINFELQTPAEPAFVRADLLGFRRCMLELIVNATEAIERNGISFSGKISVIVTKKMSADDGLERIYISVSDNGFGMSESVSDRSIEPFFSSEPADKSGLGLSEVSAYFVRFGGEIEINSEEGIGTEVVAFLPYAIDGVKNDAKRSNQPDSSSLKILVVEDEPLVRKIACKMFNKLGHTVCEAANADEGLSILSEYEADIVFSDISMPGSMNGIQLAEKLAQEYPDIEVILTTGYLDKNLAKRAMSTAMIIQKPYKLADLRNGISHLNTERSVKDE